MCENFITGVRKIEIVPTGWRRSRIISGAIKLDGPSEHGRPIVIEHLTEIRDCLIRIKCLPYSGQKPHLAQVVPTPGRKPVIIGRPESNHGIRQKSRAL